MRLSDEQVEAFAIAVQAAAGRDDLLLGVECVYQQLQDAIDLRKPRCDASGRCCRFEEYGHRLFVTTVEMAAFVGRRRAHFSEARETCLTKVSTPEANAWDGTGCPFQIAGKCGVHAIRPFGCRVFYCDASSDEWQSLQYERLHGQLKSLHTSLGVPYFYVEWREALRAVGAGGSSRSTRTTLPAL